MFRRCACHGRRLCVFCAVQTIAFPVEHLTWSQVIGPLVGWHV